MASAIGSTGCYASRMRRVVTWSVLLAGCRASAPEPLPSVRMYGERVPARQRDQQSFACERSGEHTCTIGNRRTCDPATCDERGLAYCFMEKSASTKQHEWHSRCWPTLRECIARERRTYSPAVCLQTSGSDFIPDR